jgi:hypothetical protein
MKTSAIFREIPDSVIVSSDCEENARQRNRLETVVGAIANRLVAGMFTAAKMHRFIRGGAELLRREAGSFVRPVAKRLIGALAAGAPVVILAGLYIHIIGFFLRDDWFRHDVLSSKPILY